MDSVILMWLLLVVVFIVVESVTLGLTTIWFAGGSLVAILAAMLGADIWVQLAVFIVVSVLLLFFVQPSACRKFNSKRMKTNIDTYIDAECKVIETIDNFNQKGAVLLDGKVWTARSVDSSIIQQGEAVTVSEISGVKLIVKKREIEMKKEEEK